MQQPSQNIPLWDTWLEKWFVRLLITGVFINLTGLFVTILEPDGALYATIAKTIVQSGDFINLKVEGKDWLDKPHFPFWITAISFELFGINTIAYKLPALLFWAAGGWYTYLFAKALYDKNIARLSVLIYLTAAHLVISNNDVRAEPYLTGLVIGSVYHFYKASGRKVSLHLMLGSLLAACAVMTKGPFILIVIGSGFIFNWILKKQWNELLHYRWWVAALFIFVFILPELYCLYRQFDLHPEKNVFGRTGVSGIRFFFWDSQFGRFLNTGPIKGKGDVSFYLHTLLWAFLPWSLFFYTAFFNRIRTLKFKALTQDEYITIGASLVTFLLFSFSRFQLPHYMNIVFPFFAIITAQYIYSLQRIKTVKAWATIQNILCLLLITLPVLLSVYFDLPAVLLIATVIIAASATGLYIFTKSTIPSVFGRTFITGILVYGFLNLAFYPVLLKYQSGSEAANFINQQEPGKTVCTYHENSYSFAFYIHQPIEYHYSRETIKEKSIKHEVLVFTNEGQLPELIQAGLTIQILKRFPHFHISKLSRKFLNEKTRQTVTKKMVVVKVAVFGGKQ